MLGVFGKLPGAEPVKTRLQARLTRAEAERFYLASLADTLETACRVVDRPVLFLSTARASRAEAGSAILGAGLDPATWRRVRLEYQVGNDLGERLDRAFGVLCAEGRAGLIVGSDSPSLDAEVLRGAFEALKSADVVLGPTTDGGYYAIGTRRPHTDLLRDIPWSTDRALVATNARAQELGLRVQQLATWTDVDRPEDLAVLASQIAALRARRDAVTARLTEGVLVALGIPAPDSPSSA